MTNPLTHHIEQAIQALITDGKEPSVALIKTRITCTVPIPLIIQTLQLWKRTRLLPKKENVSKKIREKENSPEDRMLTLEKEIENLKARVVFLESRLHCSSEKKTAPKTHEDTGKTARTKKP